MKEQIQIFIYFIGMIVVKDITDQKENVLFCLAIAVISLYLSILIFTVFVEIRNKLVEKHFSKYIGNKQEVPIKVEKEYETKLVNTDLVQLILFYIILASSTLVFALIFCFLVLMSI